MVCIDDYVIVRISTAARRVTAPAGGPASLLLRRRGAMCRRMLAASLLALAASPFTAPFLTCDISVFLAAPVPSATGHASLRSSTSAHDAAQFIVQAPCTEEPSSPLASVRYAIAAPSILTGSRLAPVTLMARHRDAYPPGSAPTSTL